MCCRSGIKTYDLIERKGDGEFWFEAEIGKPKFASDEVPVLTTERREAGVDQGCGQIPLPRALAEPIGPAVDQDHARVRPWRAGQVRVELQRNAARRCVHDPEFHARRDGNGHRWAAGVPARTSAAADRQAQGQEN